MLQVSRVDFWRGEEYQSLFRALEDANGFFRYRYGIINGHSHARTRICPRVGAHVLFAHVLVHMYNLPTALPVLCGARESRRGPNVTSDAQVGRRAGASSCSCCSARETGYGDAAECQLLASEFRQDMGGLTSTRDPQPSTLNPKPYTLNQIASYLHQSFVRI